MLLNAAEYAVFQIIGESVQMKPLRKTVKAIASRKKKEKIRRGKSSSGNHTPLVSSSKEQKQKQKQKTLPPVVVDLDPFIYGNKNEKQEKIESK